MAKRTWYLPECFLRNSIWWIHVSMLFLQHSVDSTIWKAHPALHVILFCSCSFMSYATDSVHGITILLERGIVLRASQYFWLCIISHIFMAAGRNTCNTFRLFFISHESIFTQLHNARLTVSGFTNEQRPQQFVIIKSAFCTSSSQFNLSRQQ
jgi:hypothetical protein